MNPDSLPMSDSVQIRPLSQRELEDAFDLSTDVGWNQSRADWNRMLTMEESGCLCAASGGRLLGTTLCCTFGDVAWLAMVIVQPAWRGQGLGKRLVQQGLEFAMSRNVTTIRLDATPLGERVYRKLGFQPQFELIRMAGQSSIRKSAPDLESGAPLCVAEPSEFSALCHLDFEATQTNREKLLTRLFSEMPPWILKSSDGATTAYLARREGRMAIQLGPCAGPVNLAARLLELGLRSCNNQIVIVDIPEVRQDLLEIAAQYGLCPQRKLLRMCRGKNRLENLDLYHVSYGGEFG